MKVLIDREDFLMRVPEDTMLSIEEIQEIIDSMPVYGSKHVPFLTKGKAMALLDVEHDANDKLVRKIAELEAKVDSQADQLREAAQSITVLQDQAEYWQKQALNVYNFYKAERDRSNAAHKEAITCA